MTSGKTYANTTIQIHDLVDTDGVIQDCVFNRCDIVGPAIVVARHSLFTYSRWDEEPDVVLWELPRGRAVIGAMLMERCTFSRCIFRGIGMAGLAEDLEWFRSVMVPPAS